MAVTLSPEEQQLLTEVLDKVKQLIDRNAFVTKDGKTIAKSKCYGTAHPSTLPNPVEGQIYFHIQ